NGTLETKRIGWDTEIESVATGASGGHGGADEILVDHLYKMMTEDAETLTSVEDGLNAAITCFALQDAMGKDQIVDMREYWAQLDLVGA
ncbi:MAG: hypothetical protein HRU15_15240, partial [Planctomycetes bacterium]|nr:hypothetical protein [Planctomycetota bacterium]